MKSSPSRSILMNLATMSRPASMRWDIARDQPMDVTSGLLVRLGFQHQSVKLQHVNERILGVQHSRHRALLTDHRTEEHLSRRVGHDADGVLVIDSHRAQFGMRHLVHQRLRGGQRAMGRQADHPGSRADRVAGGVKPGAGTLGVGEALDGMDDPRPLIRGFGPAPNQVDRLFEEQGTPSIACQRGGGSRGSAADSATVPPAIPGPPLGAGRRNPAPATAVDSLSIRLNAIRVS